MGIQSGILNRVLEKLSRESDIRIRSHLCSRIRYPRSNCRACQDVCPSGSVNIDTGSVTLRQNCSGCEICIPACPNGVFTLNGRKEKERREQIKKGLESDSIARFTCIMNQRKTGAGIVVLPCLAGLSEAYLIAPFAWGAKKVQIRRTGCGACPFSAGMKRYEQLLMRTAELLACFDIPAVRIEEVETFDLLKEPSTAIDGLPGEGLGRRELFNLFRKRTVETTMDLIPESREDRSEIRWSHRENPMRSFLLELLPFLGDHLEETLSFKAFPVVDLKISMDCLGCNVCETLCPTGAIRREVDEDEKRTRLFFNTSKCTGCRICGEACLPKAISFAETVFFRELLGGGEKELIGVAAKHCRICGKIFHGIPGEKCPECFGSHQRGER